MDPAGYRVLARPGVARVEDRRSVFLGRVERVGSEEEARAAVAAARTEHWDARHHCSAFVLGPDRVLRRSSDDGEPAGTAGPPMLEVLVGSGLSDVVAVVSRWFGGTLLGTGGLVKAYSEAVRAALQGVPAVERVPVRTAYLRVGHATAGRVEHELRAAGVLVRDVRYAAEAVLELAVPVTDEALTEEVVARATGGQGRLEAGGTGWLDRERS